MLLLADLQLELQIIDTTVQYCDEINYKPSTYNDLVTRKQQIIEIVKNLVNNK